MTQAQEIRRVSWKTNRMYARALGMFKRQGYRGYITAYVYDALDENGEEVVSTVRVLEFDDLKAFCYHYENVAPCRVWFE